MISSSLELALLILAVEFGALCVVILFKTRQTERTQQTTAVAEVSSLVGAVERTEDTRKEALRTTLQEIYKVDAQDAEGMVEEFVEREHAFYNAVIGIHLGRSGKTLSDLPAEVTRLIAPWLRLTPRGQVDASEASALAERNNELSSELGETRKVLERLMAEYSAAFDREQAAAKGAAAEEEGLLSMDDAVAPPAAPAAEAPLPDEMDEAAAPGMSPDTIINLDETEEPTPSMSQDDLDALLENLGEDIFGTGNSSAQDADKPAGA